MVACRHQAGPFVLNTNLRLPETADHPSRERPGQGRSREFWSAVSRKPQIRVQYEWPDGMRHKKRPQSLGDCLERQWPNLAVAPVKGGLSYIKRNGWKRWHKLVGHKFVRL